jgi:hypothetical protein
MNKILNTEEILNSLPDLSKKRCFGSIDGQGESYFSINWDGEWETESNLTKSSFLMLDPEKLKPGDIFLKEEGGEIKIHSPFFTSRNFELPKGKFSVRGVAPCISWTDKRKKGIKASEPRTYKRFIRTTEKDVKNIPFPLGLKDPNKNRYTRGYLPLKISNLLFEIYFIKEGPYLIIELRESELDFTIFQNYSNKISLLLSYLFGISMDHNFADLVFGDQMKPDEVFWYSGIKTKSSKHPVLPNCDMHLPGESGLEKIHFLSINSISQIFEFFCLNNKLLLPLTNLISFHLLPIEMRGILLSVALESLSRIILEENKIKFSPPIENKKWKPLIKRFEYFLKNEKLDLTNQETDFLKNRFNSINQPSNFEKLTRPFQLHKIELSEEEKNAINRRNDFLHGNNILDPDAQIFENENWKIPHSIEMRIFSSVSKLFLKYLGYQGPFINWGKHGEYHDDCVEWI